MNWDAERHRLTEQLAILKQLKARFGAEAMAIASQARLEVHRAWCKRSEKAFPSVRGKRGKDHGNPLFSNNSFWMASSGDG